MVKRWSYLPAGTPLPGAGGLEAAGQRGEGRRTSGATPPARRAATPGRPTQAGAGRQLGLWDGSGCGRRRHSGLEARRRGERRIEVAGCPPVFCFRISDHRAQRRLHLAEHRVTQPVPLGMRELRGLPRQRGVMRHCCRRSLVAIRQNPQEFALAKSHPHSPNSPRAGNPAGHRPLCMAGRPEPDGEPFHGKPRCFPGQPGGDAVAVDGGVPPSRHFHCQNPTGPVPSGQTRRYRSDTRAPGRQERVGRFGADLRRLSGPDTPRATPGAGP
jgi:hypothetical protein